MLCLPGIEPGPPPSLLSCERLKHWARRHFVVVRTKQPAALKLWGAWLPRRSIFVKNFGCLGPHLFPGREDSTKIAGPDVSLQHPWETNESPDEYRFHVRTNFFGLRRRAVALVRLSVGV